jgi:hypothetical protein
MRLDESAQLFTFQLGHHTGHQWYTSGMPEAHVAALLCGVAAAGGCAADPERPPIARITTSPTAILASDDFETEVTVDGSMSALLGAPGTPLDYQWRFLDDEARTGDPLDRVTLVVTFRGDRPPRIILTVTSPDGLQGEVSHQLPLTVR